MKKETVTTNQITEGVIWKQLLLFFFPIVLGTFFQQLYNTADTIVVGRFVSKEALAAVGGSAAQIVGLIVGFFVGLASGASVIISQFYFYDSDSCLIFCKPFKSGFVAIIGRPNVQPSQNCLTL